MAYIDILRNILDDPTLEVFENGVQVSPKTLPSGHYTIHIQNKAYRNFNPVVGKRYYIELYTGFVKDMTFHAQYNYGYMPALEMAGTITQVTKEYVYGVFSCTSGKRWYGWIPRISIKEFKEL